jgi:hypothetical protein
MKKAALVVLALALLLPLAAMAQSASATLAITATLQSTMQVQVVSNTAKSVAFGGSATAATLALGNVSAFGAEALPANVTQVTTPGTNFVITIPFAIQGYGANVGAPTGFTFTAARAATDSNTWAICTYTSCGTPTTVTTTPSAAFSHQNFGAAGLVNFNLTITVPISTAAGAIGDTVTFTATAS